MVYFDAKLDTIVKLAKSIVENKGHAHPEILEAIFNMGYRKANLVDLIMEVVIRSITNYLNSNTNVEIDCPAAYASSATMNLLTKSNQVENYTLHLIITIEELDCCH
ncbi:MAG: hypothetical protein H7Y07_11680 [Pyrinomonadaceae bacterium]|nr:hypothetical protein [Sphingobacteriaceae bacterium]